MKKVLMAVAMSLVSTSAFGAMVDNPACGKTGANSMNLRVAYDTLDKYLHGAGYEIMGVFFPLNVKGCEKLEYDESKRLLMCDGSAIGEVGALRADPTNDAPIGELRVLAEANVELASDCNSLIVTTSP